ncbi:MAG: hypothetical protein IJ860_03895 [Eubacterium sp.]|nr:hypothetical protein [Eubacterium sp.]
MSRFLKVVVRILLILMILAGAALLVPPFAGIDTVVVENESNSNQVRGTVIYAKSVDPSQLQAGDRLLRVTEDRAVNTYLIRSYDGSSRTITAVKSEGAAEEELHATGTVRRILLSVPYLGFLSIATQSLTGLMILGGAILILIILFVIAELLSSTDDEDDEDDEEDEDRTPDSEYFSTLHSKKKEPLDTGRKAYEIAAEEAEPQADEFPVEGEGEEFIKNLKGAISGNELSGTGEINAYSEREEAEAAESEEMTVTSEPGFETPEEPKAVPDEEDPVPTDGLPDVQAALEAALEGRQISYSNNVQHPGVVEREMQKPKSGEIELAIPIRSAEEFLEQAAANGDAPNVREDQLTGVKFVDYTDCL